MNSSIEPSAQARELASSARGETIGGMNECWVNGIRVIGRGRLDSPKIRPVTAQMTARTTRGTGADDQ